MPAFKHILVPTDFHESSERALAVALDLAVQFESEVMLLHAAWLPPYYYAAYAEGLAWPLDELEGQAKTALDAAVTKAKERYPKIVGSLTAGEPWQQILEASKERGADLIVMGTHGRRGVSRIFLGSVAEKVVRLSPIPVLTVSTEAERRAKEDALVESSAREGVT